MRYFKISVAFATVILGGIASGDSQDALLDAIVENDIAKVRLLLADGEFAPIDAFSYLSAALQPESTRILEALLEFGVPADARADGGLRATAMMYAAYRDRADMMQVLANAGADIDLPDDRGDPPINWAAYGGKREAVAWLLANNARLDQVGHGTALEIAKRRGFTAIATEIAAVQFPVDLDGTIVKLAAAIDQNEVDKSRQLIESGASATAVDETGRPLLHRAARQNRIDIVKAMLASGADVNLPDDIGFTALMESARDRHADMVALLLEHGADANAIALPAALNMTPIHLACIGGDAGIIRALHTAGADLDAQDTDGTTAVIWALGEGHREAADLMLELGADPDIENQFGSSATTIIEFLDARESE